MKLIIRITLALLLVLVGASFFSHCFDFELKLYETNLTPYFYSGVVARIVLSLYFVLAVFWLAGKPSKFLSILTLLWMLLPLYFIVIDKSQSQIIQVSALSFLPSFSEVPLLLAGVVLACISFVFKMRSFTSSLWLQLTKYIVAAGSVAVVFVVHPLFLDEFTDESNKFEMGQIGEVELDKKIPSPQLRAYFSTSCPYCEMASKRLKLLEKNYQGFPQVKLYFLGDEERVQWFFEDTRTKFDYEIMETGTFLRITGGSFPKFVYLNQEEGKLLYTGRTFNYGSPKIISAN